MLSPGDARDNSEQGGDLMNAQDVKKIAVERGIKTCKMKKGDIIRAIQTKEGNPACFDTGAAASCGEAECLWKEDCK